MYIEILSAHPNSVESRGGHDGVQASSVLNKPMKMKKNWFHFIFMGYCFMGLLGPLRTAPLSLRYKEIFTSTNPGDVLVKENLDSEERCLHILQLSPDVFVNPFQQF